MNDDIRDLENTAKRLVCGGLSGTAGIITGQPLDTIKVRIQTEPGVYKSAYECFTKTVQNEGVLSLYKGMSAPLVAQFFQNALVFTGESVALSYLEPDMDFDADMSDQTVRNVFMAGSFGGFMQCLVLVPSDLVKCRLQVDHSGPGKGLYKGSLDCLSKVYNAEGIKGLYKGFAVTSVREVPAYGIYFFVYRYTRNALNTLFEQFKVATPTPTLTAVGQSKNTKNDKNTGPGLSTLLAGGMAGSASWICIYPFDVIKSHIQTAPSGENGAKALNGFSTALHLYKNYGISVFTRGMGVTVARAFPVNALVFYLHETLKRILNV